MRVTFTAVASDEDSRGKPLEALGIVVSDTGLISSSHQMWGGWKL